MHPLAFWMHLAAYWMYLVAYWMHLAAFWINHKTKASDGMKKKQKQGKTILKEKKNCTVKGKNTNIQSIVFTGSNLARLYFQYYFFSIKKHYFSINSSKAAQILVCRVVQNSTQYLLKHSEHQPKCLVIENS